MQKEYKYHYVYKITNLNPQDERKYYIGVRSCDCLPEEDRKYMSSSKYLKAAISEQGQENFKKEILSIWDTREIAAIEERKDLEAVKVIWEQFYNRALPTLNGFYQIHNSNMLTVYDENDKQTKMISKYNYSINKHRYKTNATNKVSVKNIETGKTEQISVDEYNENKETYISVNKGKTVYYDNILKKNVSIFSSDFDHNRHVSPTKNKVTVIEKCTGRIISIDKDEFYNNNEKYMTKTTNMITAKNIHSNEIKSITKEFFNSSDDWVSINSNMIKIFNSDGVLEYISYGNFINFCIENNLPRALMRSYQLAGQPIFMNDNNGTRKRLEKSGQIKYRGWFAIKE